MAIYTVITIFEARSIAKRREWRELAVFLLVTLAGMALMGLILVGIRPPSLYDLWKNLAGK